MRRTVCLAVLALCLFQPTLAQPTLAQTAPTPLEVLAAKRQAVITHWEAMPMLARRVMFVETRPTVYGAATARPTNVFAAGEPIITYIEPVGYGWKPDGDMLDFGFNVDFILKETDGKILGGKTDFLKVGFASREKVTEFMLDVKLNLTGVSPGDYVLEYKLRDIASAKELTTSQKFTIAP